MLGSTLSLGPLYYASRSFQFAHGQHPVLSQINIWTVSSLGEIVEGPEWIEISVALPR